MLFMTLVRLGGSHKMDISFNTIHSSQWPTLVFTAFLRTNDNRKPKFLVTMADRKDVLLLQKIGAIATVNDEIIARIKSIKTIASGYDYHIIHDLQGVHVEQIKYEESGTRVL